MIRNDHRSARCKFKINPQQIQTHLKNSNHSHFVLIHDGGQRRLSQVTFLIQTVAKGSNLFTLGHYLHNNPGGSWTRALHRLICVNLLQFKI